jgi:predicted metalloprotease with PDZ domain
VRIYFFYRSDIVERALDLHKKVMNDVTSNADLPNKADVRLCRLCLWSNFEGFGLHLIPSRRPPHLLRIIESNSPAAATGLKICDVVLAVNNEDMCKADFNRVQAAITRERDTIGIVELLVVEQRYYKTVKKNKMMMNSPICIDAPATMPVDFINFAYLTPRVCNMRFGRNDITFGFEVVDGENDIGVYIQTVYQDSPASDAGLRKCDRIIEINDRNVDRDSSEYILNKLSKGTRKGVVKLFVADTHTYEYYIKNNMKLSSTDLKKTNGFADQSSVQSQRKARRSTSHTLNISICFQSIIHEFIYFKKMLDTELPHKFTSGSL